MSWVSPFFLSGFQSQTVSGGPWCCPRVRRADWLIGRADGTVLEARSQESEVIGKWGWLTSRQDKLFSGVDLTLARLWRRFSPSVLADLSQVLTTGEISKIPRNGPMRDPTQWEFLDTDTPKILSGRICWLINTTWWNTCFGFLESVWCCHVSQPHHCRRCHSSHSSSVATN